MQKIVIHLYRLVFFLTKDPRAFLIIGHMFEWLMLTLGVPKAIITWKPFLTRPSEALGLMRNILNY